MHININFILLQEFDVEYYFKCFIFILKVEFYSKMKWKCIFSEISPQSNPIAEACSLHQPSCLQACRLGVGNASRLRARKGRLPSEAECECVHATLRGPLSGRCKIR